MKSSPEKLIKRHEKLVHSDGVTVVSHVQRAKGEWILNTLMIDGCDVPFKYKRKQQYKSLQGAKVNLTYYPDVEKVAGMDMEIMTVVRVKVS